MAGGAMIIGDDAGKSSCRYRMRNFTRADGPIARLFPRIRESGFHRLAAVRSDSRAVNEHADGQGGDQGGRPGDGEESEPGTFLHNALAKLARN